MSELDDQVIAEFRANDGQVGGMFAGVPMVLITHTGAKSGQRRTTPLATLVDDEAGLVIFASKGGAPTHPDWYHNLVAHPQVTVEFRAETFTAHARITEGAERERLYAAQATEIPNFAAYKRKTERVIPVIVLERVA